MPAKSFLVQTTYSFTKQNANPYKVYAIDPGLYKELGRNNFPNYASQIQAIFARF